MRKKRSNRRNNLTHEWHKMAVQVSAMTKQDSKSHRPARATEKHRSWNRTAYGGLPLGGKNRKDCYEARTLDCI